MFVLLVVTVAFLGVTAHANNYLPPSVPFRNQPLFNGAAQHVSQSYQPIGSSSYTQYEHQQSQPQIPYQGQAQNNVNQYQSNGRFSQAQNTGFPSQTGFETVGYADQAGFGPQSTDIYKSLYYFDSPEDIQLPPQRIRYADAGRDSKHYKIIFIKAPAYVQQPITDIQANIGAAGGGKTIIYVLTKKPEAQQDVVINTGAAEQAVSKPEVYYIKYSSKQDAEQQISQSLNGQHGTAIPGRPVGSDQEFVGNIRDSVDARSQGPIIKNLGNANGVQEAPQGGAQILGLSQQHASGFSTSTPQGYSGSAGFSTLNPTGYNGGSTTGGMLYGRDSYGNARH